MFICFLQVFYSVFFIQMEATERNSSKHCHVFSSEPYLKMNVTNLGVPSAASQPNFVTCWEVSQIRKYTFRIWRIPSAKRGAQNCLFLDGFKTTVHLKRRYLENETRYIKLKSMMLTDAGCDEPVSIVHETLLGLQLFNNFNVILRSTSGSGQVDSVIIFDILQHPKLSSLDLN